MVVRLVLVKVFFLLVAVLVGLSVTIIRIDHLIGFVGFVDFFGDLLVDIVFDLTVDFDADLLVDFVTGLVVFVVGRLVVVCSVAVDRSCVCLYIVLSKMQLVKISGF